MNLSKNKYYVIFILSLSANILLLIGVIYFSLQYIRFENRNNWHRIKYHEYRILNEYKTKYKPGTNMAFIKKHEQKNIQKIYYKNDSQKLWICPEIEDSRDFQHYCGFTFIFNQNKLVEIVVNSPCH